MPPPPPPTTVKTEAKPKVRNIFQRNLYDRPVVLIGCSGPNDELTRLASTLTTSSSSTDDNNAKVIHAAPTFGKTESDSQMEVLDTIRSKIESNQLTRSNVIVLDFNHPTLRHIPTEGATTIASSADRTVERMINLAQTLYEELGLLGVYVNVHPDKCGGTSMSPEGRQRREKLEKDVFVRFTDYEVAIADEGRRDDGYDEDEDDGREGEGGAGAWEGIEWELKRLLSRSSLPGATPGSEYGNDLSNENTASLTMGPNTFFLSLSFPQIEQVEPYLPAMCRDVDAMEFRTDLLDCVDDRFELMRSLRTLRQMCRKHAVRAPGLAGAGGKGGGTGTTVIDDALPVVFTVRTAHQAGTYPDDPAGIARMFDILELGLRSGVEVMDVESAWDPARTDAILTTAEDRYATQILGSHHVVPDEVTMDEAVGIFRQCQLNGRSHGAKVVLSIDDESKDAMADDAGRIAQTVSRSEGQPVVPNVSLILGTVGQYSRVLNERFTPVTHESLPFVAAPGQLTASELMETRVAVGRVTPRRFGTVVASVGRRRRDGASSSSATAATTTAAATLSSRRNDAAFHAVKLPHSSETIEADSVEELVSSDLWNDPSFGGCSLAAMPQPGEEVILLPHLDRISDAAEKIGTVDTVAVTDERDFDGSRRRVLVGDNAEWRGIFQPLSRRLGVVGGSDDGDGNASSGAVLVLGGGGTARAAAYAATRLGLRPVVCWNGDDGPDEAEAIAATFGGIAVPDLSEGCLGPALAGGVGGPLRAVVIAGTTLPPADDGSDQVLPVWLVRAAASGATSTEEGRRLVVLDAAGCEESGRRTSPLLSQAEGAPGFDVVRGSEVLLEKGVGQFQLWTGRTAPYRVMRDAVLGE